MKKAIWILSVLLLTICLVCGCILFLYMQVDKPSRFPAETLYVQSATGEKLEVPLRDYLWYEPVLGGAVFKEFKKPAVEQLHIGYSIKSDSISLSLAQLDDLDLQIVVKQKDEIILECSQKDFVRYRFPSDGHYDIEVFAKRASSGSRAYGEFYYLFYVDIQLETEVSLSSDTVTQGDILRLVVKNAPGKLSGETELGPVHFIKKNGYEVAYIPIFYGQGTGEWPIVIESDEWKKEVSVWVNAGEFPQEYHVSAEGKEASVNEEMIAEYRNQIWPLFLTASEEQLWTEPFLKPVAMPVTGQYGAYVYLDDAAEPQRNSGIDIAAEKGMPVFAPNRGKVVFSGYLALTGNTVVLEHGGGLKSYFYYMDSRMVETGQIAERNMQIGTVGDNGTTEEPHLNYELKIGSRSVNPIAVFQGKSPLYFR